MSRATEIRVERTPAGVVFTAYRKLARGKAIYKQPLVITNVKPEDMESALAAWYEEVVPARKRTP